MKSRRQFVAIYDRGRRVVCPSCTIFALPNQRDHCRLGVTATRKIGGAVTRNRAKRLLREVFRRNHARLEPPMDIVVNAHRSLPEREYEEVERDFLEAWSRLARRGRR